jgi:hypothetical protein
MTFAGLLAMAGGCLTLSMVPAALGIGGYAVPLVVLAGGYALFQTANNTDVMADVPKERRGAVSGLLNLSRSLGLITGASVMGAVFALAAAAADITTAQPASVAVGMHTAFAAATALIVIALAIAAIGRRRAAREAAEEVVTATRGP